MTWQKFEKILQEEIGDNRVALKQQDHECMLLMKQNFEKATIRNEEFETLIDPDEEKNEDLNEHFHSAFVNF